ncbi:tetratricopeptide repeat protein, partial [Phytoactinopolyspora endophytica]|uniref:tetratricopeptide repeat protein n=1 Tax=Phytoactinopolyspora endophytica TaxID=1642495 RepID=UPI003B82F12D
MNNLGAIHQDRGDLESAETCLSRSLAVRREIGAGRQAEALVLCNLGELAELRGNLRRALELYEEVAEILADVPGGVEVAAAASVLG